MTTPAVQFTQVSRQFGEVKAVDRVSIDIQDGEFFSMLGPSGSGKTTCLRLIAGFEQPSAGSIRIHGEEAAGLPPYLRDVNTVFQDYALFPHMSVLENVAYGLKVKGVAKSERLARAEEALGMVALGGYGGRKPVQLSGGQRQRVALARALVNRPRVLLLDEPLGALDLKLREQMQSELKKLQRQLGITFIFVTHDQEEALTMSDRIAVMSKGQVLQVGSPTEIYEAPVNRTVADFIGETNFLDAEASESGLLLGDGQRLGLAQGERRGPVTLAIRPERVELDAAGNLEGEVETVVYVGTDTLYLLRVAGQSGFRVRRQNRDGAGDALATGTRVRVQVPPTAIRVLPR